MKLIIGLGNPGKKYEATRHNVGFDVLRELAGRWQAEPPRAKFESLVSECQVKQAKTLLVWPQTYMNRSGVAARLASTFFKAPLADLLVICDDFNLPLGKLRFRPQGSAGGQNGLDDILTQLASQEVSRLRLGVGPVPENWDAAGFVLGKFAKNERDLADAMTRDAADAVECWVEQGATQTMNQFN